MVQAIGSSAVSGSISTGAAAVGLEAQLVRYQKLLSECVNCDSSKTAKGKADIQAISVKISEVRERIDRITEVKPASQTTELASSTAAKIGTGVDAATSTKKEAANAEPVATSESERATVGSQVNLLA